MADATRRKYIGCLARYGCDQSISHLEAIFQRMLLHQSQREMTDRFVQRDHAKAVLLNKPPNRSDFFVRARSLV